MHFRNKINKDVVIKLNSLNYKNVKVMENKKKTSKRATKPTSLKLVKTNLKHLSYDELEEVAGLLIRYRKEKLGNEELRLIKEKEMVEQKLKSLKKLDMKVNAL